MVSRLSSVPGPGSPVNILVTALVTRSGGGCGHRIASLGAGGGARGAVDESRPQGAGRGGHRGQQRHRRGGGPPAGAPGDESVAAARAVAVRPQLPAEAADPPAPLAPDDIAAIVALAVSAPPGVNISHVAVT